MTAAWYIRSDYNYLRKNRKTLMKKIGIIGAMELEVETLKAILNGEEIEDDINEADIL
jgi:hypothetical protein